MKWHLGKREVIAFIGLILFLEFAYYVGDSAPFWYAFGVLAPLALLFAINLIVGIRKDRH